MTNHIYDVAIIGTGTAGLSALREVRKHTDNFVIINAGHYGTTCARVGCMPSKILIESANSFHRRGAFDALGIRGADHLQIDVAAVMRRVRRMRDEFVAGILPLTSDLGSQSIAGVARLLSPDEIEVGNQRLRARRIIIATGSRPVLPKGIERVRDRIWTTDELFEQDAFPEHLAVIGLGAIGVEVAQALSRLGVDVTAFGTGQMVGGLRDPVVNESALERLRAEVEVVMGPPATLNEDSGGVRISCGAREETFDAVFAALGRTPNIESLALQNLGVALDEAGMPPVNAHTMQVADLPVFMAGDVASDLPVLHVASDEGHVAACNAMRDQSVCFQMRVPLTIVFSDPNIAAVGARLTELDVATLAIGQVDFARQGRARIALENHGVLRIYADRSNGLLLGAEMCAPRAEHMAQLLALAISQRATVHSMLQMPFYHPVFEEGLRTALRDTARHVETKIESDLASCSPVGAAALD